jgi:HlyD family secretion protein
MSKTGIWILSIIGGLIVVFAAVKIIGAGNNKGVKVAVENVESRTIVETVPATGQIYPEVEVKISPDISGEVVELNVEEGDSVRRGQVLARIFADIYALQRDQAAAQVGQSQATVANSEAALEALRANMVQAQQAYDRNKVLYEEKVISKAELEQFETTLRSAKANFAAAEQNIKSLRATVQAAQTGLDRANKDLSRTTLVAPMDGVISSLLIKRGERVAGNSFNVGTEMMTVADMSVLEVRVNVGENDIVKVSIGDSADITVDAYNNRKFRGIVTQIASSTRSSAVAAASNEVTNYEVRIRLDKSSYADLIDPSKPRKWPFRPGMNASAEIKTRRVLNVLSVPIIAVGSRIKGTEESVAQKKEGPSNASGGPNEDAPVVSERDEVVFVVQADGTVKKVLVESGIQDINYIEIKKGLSGGESVVVSPYTAISTTLKDGMKVNVVKKEELFGK